MTQSQISTQHVIYIIGWSYTCVHDTSHMWMSHVTHIYATCHIYNWVEFHVCMRHVTHMNESCHTYPRDMSHFWLGEGTPLYATRSTYEWVMSHICTWHVTYNMSLYVTCIFANHVAVCDMYFRHPVQSIEIFEYLNACYSRYVVLVPDATKVTGWRRPIGCLKLQVIFRKRATNYRTLVRKMTHKYKGS